MVQGNEIVRIRLQADLQILPALLAFMRDLAARQGLAALDAEKLTLVLEEACCNVIEHAFEPGEKGFYDVVVERRPHGLVVAVEDQGLPFDFQKLYDRESLGGSLMRAFADEISFSYLGKKGKRIEFVKKFVFKEIGEYLTEDEKSSALTAASQPHALPDGEISFRFMRPATEEAVALSRCVYRSYGYSYANDVLYYPEKILASLQSGLVKSCVAVTGEDEIVGHLALVFDYPGARVGETGQAVVDPRIRGGGMFRRMKEFMREQMSQQGIYGFYSESVTIHPFTQKGNLAIGARETGFLLGYVPEGMYFKKIEGGEHGQRQTAVLFYLRVGKEPERTVYAPPGHEAWLRRIYENNCISRRFTGCHCDLAQLGARSCIEVNIRLEFGLAFLKVMEFGRDMAEVVGHHLRQLYNQRIDCVYIDLPLGNPYTSCLCEQLEGLGFFFSGVIPEYTEEGDILRLQKLNSPAFDPEGPCIVSDFAGELYRYIISEKTRVEQNLV